MMDSSLANRMTTTQVVALLMLIARDRDGVNLRGDGLALWRLMCAADEARLNLDRGRSAMVEVPFIAGDYHLETVLVPEELSKEQSKEILLLSETILEHDLG